VYWFASVQWGSGISSIFREAQEQGLPEPSIEEIGLHLGFTVYFAHPMTTKQAVTGHPKESTDDTASRLESALAASPNRDTNRPVSFKQMSLDCTKKTP